VTLIPAYGRDYKSAAAVKADWEADKDFSDAMRGYYVNRADLRKYGTDEKVFVRYCKHTKIVEVFP